MDSLFKCLLVMSVFSLMACQGTSTGSNNSSSTGGGTDDSTPVDPEPTNSSLFYVHGIPETGVTGYTHVKDQSWDTKCTVDLDAPLAADRSKTCIVEMQEYDTYMTKLTLKYNVPSHPKCRYIWRRPYYFALREPGVGPTAISYFENSAGEIQPTVTYSGGSSGSSVYLSKGQIYCKYDYSINPDGSNCCKGEYTASISKPDGMGGFTVSTELRDWGGRPTACFSGPAMDTQEVDRDGFPRPIAERLFIDTGASNKLHLGGDLASIVDFDFGEAFAGSAKIIDHPQLYGRELTRSRADWLPAKNEPSYLKAFPALAKLLAPTATVKKSADEEDTGQEQDADPFTGLYEINSPVAKLAYSNIYVANFYEDENTLPTPVLNPNGFTTNAYYDYWCTDEAFEVYAKIKIMVREWNTVSQFQLNSNTADANVSGNETDFPEENFQDRRDWKDFTDDTTNFPGAYPRSYF